ncbi:DNA (cytosine-5-)-methyltransferase [Leptospirillum ferriphilum]|uniref:Cytosine-specific methyltransferase n=1 Tax=Leptospirillum ferriphilum (strain ML-04) TaxID=1048260 RepID=J9ZDC5_LEPFM|nr:DNA (cytosine-5-)-methyltransferase [Leptospirillum ferriphilum]AFS54374.1 DNA-cytosine methyltransferase [Leptospirillum ferriphilum ML-04]
MTIAEEIKVLRERLNLSQREISSRLGYSHRTIVRWEQGKSAPKTAVLQYLREISEKQITRKVNGNPAFRFIDLFAGIGGMRLGFETAGGECVFTCEWNPEARKTYQANFPCDHPVAGDIRDVRPQDIPSYDVLVAGFPCQPFSIAGVSKKNALGKPHGFHCETQGTLFFEVARLLEVHRPPVFVLENVKNLVSHDRGNTFRVILKTLREELGYSVHYRIIDARSWVPQHRERIFIVGFRSENGFSFDDLEIPVPSSGPVLGSILHPEDGSESPEAPYTVGDMGTVSDKYILSDRLWNYLQDYAARHKAKGNGFGFGLAGPDSVARTLSARYYKDGSEILVARKDGNPRRLTPRECARLMGFDRPGRPPFRIPVSDTQAYRQFGNAVVVPVVEALANGILPYIERDSWMENPLFSWKRKIG